MEVPSVNDVSASLCMAEVWADVESQQQTQIASPGEVQSVVGPDLESLVRRLDALEAKALEARDEPEREVSLLDMSTPKAAEKASKWVEDDLKESLKDVSRMNIFMLLAVHPLLTPSVEDRMPGSASAPGTLLALLALLFAIVCITVVVPAYMVHFMISEEKYNNYVNLEKCPQTDKIGWNKLAACVLMLYLLTTLCEGVSYMRKLLFFSSWRTARAERLINATVLRAGACIKGASLLLITGATWLLFVEASQEGFDPFETEIDFMIKHLNLTASETEQYSAGARVKPGYEVCKEMLLNAIALNFLVTVDEDITRLLKGGDLTFVVYCARREYERLIDDAGGELDLAIRAQLRLLSPGYALNQALLTLCGRSSQKSVSQVLLVWFTVLSYLFSAAVLVGLPICV